MHELRSRAHARRGARGAARRADRCTSTMPSSTTWWRSSRRPARRPRSRSGASPRSTVVLTRCAQARAVALGRDHVLPDDVKALASAVLAHRMVPRQARAGAEVGRRVVGRVLDEVPVPAARGASRAPGGADAMRLRKRAFGLLFGAGLLFFLGTNVQAGWLFVLAAMLLGAVLAGVVLPATATRGVVVERRAPARSSRASPVARRHHGARGPADDPARADRARPVPRRCRPLGRGRARRGSGSRSRRLRAGPSPGLHGPGQVTVRSAAPFGVAERRRRVHGDGRRHARAARGRAARCAAVRATGLDDRDRDAHRPASRPGSRVPRHPRVPPRRQHAARALGLDRAHRRDDGARVRAGADPAPRDRRRRLARR